MGGIEHIWQVKNGCVVLLGQETLPFKTDNDDEQMMMSLVRNHFASLKEICKGHKMKERKVENLMENILLCGRFYS